MYIFEIPSLAQEVVNLLSSQECTNIFLYADRRELVFFVGLVENVHAQVRLDFRGHKVIPLPVGLALNLRIEEVTDDPLIQSQLFVLHI